MREKTKEELLREIEILRQHIAEIERKESTHKQALALDVADQDYRNLAESLSEVVYRADPDSFEATYVNSAIEKCYGYTEEEWLSNPRLWERSIHPEDKSRVLSEFKKAKRDLKNSVITYRIIRKDKSICWVEDHVSWERDERGRAVSMDGVMYDITRLKEIEEKLRRSYNHLENKFQRRNDELIRINKKLNKEIITHNKQANILKSERDKLKSLLDGVSQSEIGIDVVSKDYKIIFLNKILRKRFGNAVGKLCYETYMKRSRPCDVCPMIKSIKYRRLEKVELIAGDGRNYKLISVPFLNPDGSVDRAIEVILDCTELKKFKTISDKAGYGAAIADLKGNVIYVNDSFAKMHGYKPTQLIGKHFSTFHSEEQMPAVRKYIKRLKQKGNFVGEEIWHKRRDGTVFPSLMSGTMIEGGKGKPMFMFVTMIDISIRKQAQDKLGRLNQELIRTNKKLKELILRDAQTGLYNHRYLTEVIDAEFHRAKRYEHSLSVIMLDIDYFKSINDVYGHRFGDLILKQFSRLLKKTVRRYDIAIRFGGEEFLVISPGTDRTTALRLAGRLLETINLYRFGDKERVVEVKLSIAVASYPEDNIVEGMDLIRLTDRILNKVKERGGNNVYSSLDIAKEVPSPAEEDKDIAEVKFLREKLDKLTKKANQSLIEAVFAFVKTIKLKDRYTGEHVERMVYYATEIAKTLNLSKEDIEAIQQASVLHDLGKIGICEKILLKSARLNKKEFEVIKKHPQIGVDIIRPIHFLHSIIPIVLYHHEKWNGDGYPKGLKGEEIPIGARIVAVADVYQALISDRPYRKAFSKQEAIGIVRNGSGVHFDPKVVSTFLDILER